MKIGPIVDRARALRRDGTEAERRLWSRLRRRQLGAHFRRQHPIAGFVLDFCCLRGNLVIEVDGAQHGEPGNAARDARRDRVLGELGFRVLRFCNRDVLCETDSVVEQIRHELARAAPPPAPLRGATSPFGLSLLHISPCPSEKLTTGSGGDRVAPSLRIGRGACDGAKYADLDRC